MSAWAKPGVKVVCVNGNWTADQKRCSRHLPAEKVIYTIRDTLVVKGKVGIRLEEIVNPPYDFKDDPQVEPPFPAWHFRPLITQDQDVSLFTHHLDGLPVGADA